jgi:hypothetical protein
MLSGLASSLTDAGPRLSRSTMSRLLGSDSAWNTRSSLAVWLSTYLTIGLISVDSQAMTLLWGIPAGRPRTLMAADSHYVESLNDKRPKRAAVRPTSAKVPAGQGTVPARE